MTFLVDLLANAGRTAPNTTITLTPCSPTKSIGKAQSCEDRKISFEDRKTSFDVSHKCDISPLMNYLD